MPLRVGVGVVTPVLVGVDSVEDGTSVEGTGV